MILSTNTADNYDYYEIYDYCKRLLGNSLYNSEERVKLGANIDDMDVEDLERFTLHLMNNQIDPINAGHNYQQGDILRKLKQ